MIKNIWPECIRRRRDDAPPAIPEAYTVFGIEPAAESAEAGAGAERPLQEAVERLLSLFESVLKDLVAGRGDCADHNRQIEEEYAHIFRTLRACREVEGRREVARRIREQIDRKKEILRVIDLYGKEAPRENKA